MRCLPFAKLVPLAALLGACGQARRPAEVPAAARTEEARFPIEGVRTPSEARLRVGPVEDGVVGPLVVDDGDRTAMVLARPLGAGRYRVELALETDGPPVVRALAETAFVPRGFALTLGGGGGLLAWLEGDGSSAAVWVMPLTSDGVAAAAARRIAPGRTEPYWVATRIEDGRRLVIVAERDAFGATVRARQLGEGGEEVSAPVALARRVVAWTTHREIPLVLLRDDGGSLRLEALAVDGRGTGRVLAAANLEGSATRGAPHVDVSGAGDGLLFAASVADPTDEVVFFRREAGAFARIARTDGRVVAATDAGGASEFLIAKEFPTREGLRDVSVLRLEGSRVREVLLPDGLASDADMPLPPSLAATGDGTTLAFLGRTEDVPKVYTVALDGAVARRPCPEALAAAWNVRRRGAIVRNTRFEARPGGVDLVDGPLACAGTEETLEGSSPVPGIVTHFRTTTGRIDAASIGSTSYVARFEDPAVGPSGDDVDARGLRLVALSGHGRTEDDRITERAQTTASGRVATRGLPVQAPLVATTWLAREAGVQQGHALILDAKPCKVQPCAGGSVSWPLPRKRYRRLTKARGDVTDFVLVPTDGGYLGAWIEQVARGAVVVAATFDAELERTSRFERVGGDGSLATDLVAVRRGSAVWLAWIEGAGGTLHAPRAVPTLARVASHDARVERSPTPLSPTEGVGGALALAANAEGLLVGFIEREGIAEARAADDPEGVRAFLTVLLIDGDGKPIGESIHRGTDAGGAPCDLALGGADLVLERCRPSAFTLEFERLDVTKSGLRSRGRQEIVRGLRPATQERPLALDDRRLLWLQNDEAGDAWLRSLPLDEARSPRDAQK